MIEATLEPWHLCAMHVVFESVCELTSIINNRGLGSQLDSNPSPADTTVIYADPVTVAKRLGA